MIKYYLAVDIGASSGRHILGHLENGRMVTQEVYRFENGMSSKDGELCWDLEQLFGEIKAGMKKCAELEKIPISMGIDTWGVDFVLLDSADRILGNTVGYRDKRTIGMDEKVYAIISEEELYERTGIQKAIFNTIYQLMAVKDRHPEILNAAESLLMIPDYFHYLLTGKKAVEYTNATTGQLIDPEKKDWDRELIGMLGYPQKIFGEILKPGTVLGQLKEEVAKEVGFNCQVVLPATHDTGSAVAAVPSNSENVLYISSGTWSLLGVERMEADCSLESKMMNFTNEGGYDYRFRYLKNIMGLWMIQSVRNEYNRQYSFAQLCEMAEQEKIPSIVDCNDASFLAPDSMVAAIQDFCKKSGQQVPKTAGELACVIYNSLAECYRETVQKLEAHIGVQYDSLHIVGGGSNADYLNQLTAKATQKTVYAGPSEATAIGNLAAQMIREGELADLKAARSCIFASSEIKIFQPG
ncbi:MAG: rhamnulokinase [Lachnospiraceae bacterium]|nr:rhamnulokinase [Lachnospiraceae bacterium]